MSNYRRGADFERQVLKDLEKRGFVAARAAGSHTPSDIYAVQPGRVLFVQCKRDGVLRPLEWNAFYDYCKRAGAVPLVAYKLTRGIAYMLITGYKDGTRTAQPWEVYEWSN